MNFMLSSRKPLKSTASTDKNGDCYTLLAPYIYIHLSRRIHSTKFRVISKKAIEIKPRPQVIEGQLVATILNNMMKLLNWWIVVILGFGDLKTYIVRNHGCLNKWSSTQMSITYSCFHFHGMRIWSPIIPSDTQII